MISAPRTFLSFCDPHLAFIPTHGHDAGLFRSLDVCHVMHEVKILCFFLVEMVEYTSHRIHTHLVLQQ